MKENTFSAVLPSTSTITLLVSETLAKDTVGTLFDCQLAPSYSGEDGVGDVGGDCGEAGEDGVVLGGVGVDGDGVEGVDGDGDVGVVLGGVGGGVEGDG
ncbi:hypothetical protein TIFTF001_007052, partial [Ficus carica]